MLIKICRQLSTDFKMHIAVIPENTNTERKARSAHMAITCNIDKSDRTNRIVIGALMIIAALLGAGWWFLMLVGIVLVVEGAIGWCSIPYLMEKLRGKMGDGPKK